MPLSEAASRPHKSIERERLAFFGGSFDPPHLGHLGIARAARGRLSLDRVLFAPTGLQPLKSDGAEASFADRLAMVALLCQADGDSFFPSSLDEPRVDHQPNYTVDALEQLHTLLPRADLYVIVGADSFLDFTRWRSADKLLHLAEWIVVSRPGHMLYDVPSLITGHRQVHSIDGVAIPIASRELRLRLHAGDTCNDAIPPGILAYIRRHHLYGT